MRNEITTLWHASRAGTRPSSMEAEIDMPGGALQCILVEYTNKEPSEEAVKAEDYVLRLGLQVVLSVTGIGSCDIPRNSERSYLWWIY